MFERVLGEFSKPSEFYSRAQTQCYIAILREHSCREYSLVELDPCHSRRHCPRMRAMATA